MSFEWEVFISSLAIGGIGGLIRLVIIRHPTPSELWAVLLTVVINTAVFFAIAPAEASPEVRTVWYTALFAVHIGITLERWLVAIIENIRDRIEEWGIHQENSAVEREN